MVSVFKVHEAKTNLSKLIERALAGEDVVIARGNKPAVKLVPVESKHRDPFDRLLIAQAQIENAYLVSNERMFDDFGVRRLW